MYTYTTNVYLITSTNARGNIRSQLGLSLFQPLDVHIRVAVTLPLDLPSNLYPKVHSYSALTSIYSKLCALSFNLMFVYKLPLHRCRHA